MISNSVRRTLVAVRCEIRRCAAFRPPCPTSCPRSMPEPQTPSPLGKKIQLVYRDTKTNAKIAKANAIELFDKEGVPMIFGGSASSEAIESGQVALQKNKLFFGTLTYSTETTGEYGHRHIFRECYDSYFAANALADYLKKNFAGKKWFQVLVLAFLACLLINNLDLFRKTLEAISTFIN